MSGSSADSEGSGHHTGGVPPIDTVDLAETGLRPDGTPDRLDRRLYAQLLVFTGCPAATPLVAHVDQAGIRGALYEDVNDPRGVGLVAVTEHPDELLDVVRATVNAGPFAALQPRPELTMLGRTYSLGHEQDLAGVLLHRPLQRIENAAWPWAVWYPIKRAGAFEQLSADEQRAVLMEHAGIGRGFASGDLVHDLRLSCHGLHRDDADFITGLFSGQLHPLSAIVQRMRKTAQTSRYLQRLGPFFVGRVRWRSAPRDEL